MQWVLSLAGEFGKLAWTESSFMGHAGLAKACLTSYIRLTRRLHTCCYHHSSQYSPLFNLSRFPNKVYRKKVALLLPWTNSWSCYPVFCPFLFCPTKEDFSSLLCLFPLLCSSSYIVQAKFSATWKMFQKSLFFDLIKKSEIVCAK